MSELPRAVEGADWLRLKVLIEQTELRVKLWEVEARRAERRWHRAVYEVDRRGLTSTRSLTSAYVVAAAKERVWVPGEKLKADLELLAYLYELRGRMLAESDGSECEA